MTGDRVSIGRLILVPALISIGVSLLRLTGELLQWSGSWFSTETGGITPSGWSWLIGITWLPVPFGIYFAWTLLRAGQGPPLSAIHSLVYSLVGAAIVFLSGYIPFPLSFPEVLLAIWAMMVLPAFLAYRGWPALGRVLLAYAFAARLPVAVIMFFAMRGKWGTHYDYVGMPPAFQMEFWRGFFWLAFFPQLVFWVAFSVLLGSLAGSIAAVVTRSPAVKLARPANTSRLAS